MIVECYDFHVSSSCYLVEIGLVSTVEQNLIGICRSFQTWGIIKALCILDEFTGLDRDMEGSPKRWKKLVDSEAPEKEKLPQDWKSQPPLIRMCILRALRPDRMTYALR